MTKIRGKEQIQPNTVVKSNMNIADTGDAVVTKIVAGANITIEETGIDDGTGEVTINATGDGGGGDGIVWEKITAANYVMEENHGYMAYNDLYVQFYLPAVCAELSIFRVASMEKTEYSGWQVRLNNEDQVIRGLGQATLTGNEDNHIQSVLPSDTVELICTVEDLEFQIISAIGNINFCNA
jgi:hypothetical protein